ncbi:hypothetical protein EV1_012323 [Malus domestica]|uniref:uncharacterized protein LOC126595650 isoform X2 n=1 Tax=Malus sylvestris TaxID=3752 RepID=UPI0021ACE269|nr:uncharacterized protein LOC126595650 isoform X2 [Malus sylvestris]
MDSPSSVLSSDDATAVKCSICMEGVSDNCGRTIVKLQCSHLFHLDCIGSAFNVKGIMECPNCREIENGKWRYYVSCSPDREPDLSEDEMDYEDSPIEFLDMGLQGTMLRRFHHGEWEMGWLSPTRHSSEPHFEAGLLDPYSVFSGNPYTYNQWTGLPVPSEVFPSNPSRIDWRPEPLICDSCTNLFSTGDYTGGANWSLYPSATLSSGIDYIGMPNAPFVPLVVEGGYESPYGFGYQRSNDPLHPNFRQQLPTNFPSQVAHASMGRSNDLMHWLWKGQTTPSLGQTADSIPFSVNMNSSLSSATNDHRHVQEGNGVQPQRLFPEDAGSLTSFFPDVNQ